MSIVMDRTRNELIEEASEVNQLADDLLVGAEAIAKELNWLTPEGQWNRRRVYHVAEKGEVPIHRVKGLGICARRSTLKAFFDRLDRAFLDDLDRPSRR